MPARWRRALIVAAAILACVLLGIGLCHTGWVRSRVLARLGDEARARFGLTLEAERLDYNLLTLSFTLVHVRLTAATSETNRHQAPVPVPAFLEADLIDVDLPWSILTGPLEIESLRLARPRVMLVRDAGGTLNLPTRPAGVSGGGLRRLPLGRLTIAGASVQYQDSSRDLAIDLLGIDAGLTGQTRGGIGGSLVARGGAHIRAASRDVTSSRLDARLGWDGSELSVDALTLAWSDAAVEVRGRLALLADEPRMDGSYRAAVDVGRVARWFPAAGPVWGTVAVTGEATGPIASPALTMQIAGGVSGGTVVGTGHVSLWRASSGEVRFDYQGVELRQVLDAARITLPFQVGARLDGRGAASWDYSRRHVLQATLENDARGSGSQSSMTLAGRATLRVERGAWTLTHTHSLGDAIEISGVAEGRRDEERLSESPLAGDVTVRARNLSAVIGALDRTGLDLDPVVNAGIGGDAGASLALSGSLGSPRGTGLLTIAGFTVASSVPAALEARVEVDPAHLQLDEIALTEGANSVRGRVRMGFAQGTLAGNARADLPEAEHYLRLVPVRWRPAASIAVEAQIEGTITGPRIGLSITGDSVAVAGQRFERLSANARIDGKGIHADEVTLVQDSAAGAGIRLAGRYEFDRRAYTVTLSGQNVDIGPVPAGPDESSPLPIAAHGDVEFEGSGTIDRPAGRARLAFNRLAWDRFEIGPTEATLVLDGETARVSAGAPELQLTASASVAIEAPHRFVLDGRVADGTLERWAGQILGPDRILSGTASLTVEASGDLDRLESTEAEITVDRLDAALGGATVRLAEPARVRYAAGQLAAGDVELRSGAAAVRLSGLLSPRPEDSNLALALDGDLQDVEPWLRELTGRSFVVRGQVRAQARAEGTAARPVIEADLALDAGEITVGELPPVGGVGLRATFRDGVLQIRELRGEWQGATVTAEGRMPAVLLDRWLPTTYVDSLPAGDRLARLKLHAAPITNRAFAPWLPRETLAEIEADAAATLAIETDALQLDRLRGELVFDRLSLALARVPFDQETPTRFQIAGGRVTAVDWRWGAPSNRIEIGGAITLGDVPEIDARVRGTSDLRSIGAFVRGVSAAGQAGLDVRVRGPIRNPDLSGTVTISSGELRVRSPRVAVVNLVGAVDLTGSQLVVREMTGTANGGALRLNGTLQREGLSLTGGVLTAVGRGIAFEWPKGLRTELDGDVTFTPTPEGAVLGGKVVVRRGAYRDPLVLTAQALEAMRTPPPVSRSPEDTPWLDRVRFDVAVVTAEEVTVDNNYGRFDLGADLRLLGSPATAALAGRLTMREGGQFFLGGNVFTLERGTIDFVDPRAIRPELNFRALTRVSSYEIYLSARGAPDALTVELTSSDSTLTRSDLASLLLTGQKATDLPLATSQQVSAQMLTLLSGDLLGLAGQRVGLDAVRVERGEPSDLFSADLGLLSTETKDPSARLSVTKRLSAQIDVVLSQNLRDEGGLTWIVVYRPGRDLEIRGIARDDGSRSLEATQRLAFGGPTPEARRTEPRERLRVAEIRITGTGGLPESDLRARLKVRSGDRFDFYDWQKDQDTLDRFYRERGYLEARVSARREESVAAGSRLVVLEYDIAAGPRTELKVEGYRLSKDLRRALEDAWADAVFDGFLLDDIRTRTLEALARDNYLRAEVAVEMARRGEGSETVKTLSLRITPGPPTSVRSIEFSGNTQIATSRLQTLVRQRGLDLPAWLAPAELESAIVSLYASEGFLAAAATVNVPRFEGSSAFLPVTIVEGPAFEVADVIVEGVVARKEADVRAAFAVKAGEPYRSATVEGGRQAIEAGYRQDGYNHAHARVVRDVDRERHRVAIRLIVAEGKRQVLAGVEITGLRTTDQIVVTRALEAEVGGPVNLEQWAQARTRLYETGVFRSADIQFEPVRETPESEATESVRAAVSLEELPPYRFSYGAQFGDRIDTATDMRVTSYGVLADLQRSNLFGRAITAGLVGRYERNRWAARAYASSPRFLILPFRSSLYLTRAHEFVPVTSSFSFVEDRWTATAEQEARWREILRLTWGYRFERTHVFDPDVDPDDPLALDVTLNIARLTSALTADTRDDPFAPRSGWFSGATLEYSAPFVGSDIRFLKTLLQGYYFRGLGPSVLASAARLGTITGPNAIVSELFLAGGGTTVRGYPENSLGEKDSLGDPKGGKGMLIFNQEVRFPIVWWFQGVGFVDAGNVFENPGDLSLSGLKVGIGGGLRLNTPFALFRLDLGVPLSRRSGEPRARWYFSLGHIF